MPLIRSTVKLTVVFILAVFSTMFLYGCGGKDTENLPVNTGIEEIQPVDDGTEKVQSVDYDIEEVRCIYNYGGRDGAELDIFRSDGTVTRYIVEPYSDSDVNLFEGEIPADDQCEKKEITITGEDWNTIAEAVKSSDFMKLPEELPKVEANDGSTCYIEIETSVGNHRSGGYCAGNGSGNKHERFYSVKSVLMKMIKG